MEELEELVSQYLKNLTLHKMFAYIKDGILVVTSDSLIKKLQLEQSEIQTVSKDIFDDDGELVSVEYSDELVVTVPFEDGMAYDEVIETEIEWRICYENGEIVPWEDSEEKKAEDKKTSEQIKAQEIVRVAELKKRIGELAIAKAAAIELDENADDISQELNSLKEEYQSLNS